MRSLIIGVSVLVGAFLLLLAIAAFIGSRLPVGHVASRSIFLHQSNKEIYALLRDFKASPSWRADVTSVELLGQPAGKLNFREHGKQGDVTYELAEDVPEQKIVTRIVDQNLGYSGSWTTELTPENGRTKVTITENGEVTNVLFRFMSRYVFGHTASIEGYLQSLAKHFGESSAQFRER